MSRVGLILNDFTTRISDKGIESKYLDLYGDYSVQFQRIFAYLHQSFNNLFEFMNNKFRTNGHYNADASRDLIWTINFFEDLNRELKGTENEIVIDQYYQAKIELCNTFLSSSGGSPIPSDFEIIHVKNYDPILKVVTKKITISNLVQSSDLVVIGEGAFCIVKKYHDPFYNKFFAVKQAKKDLNARELERFKNEFNILRKLNFQYVLEVYSYDEEKNCYIMEYCDLTLEEFIKRNNQSLAFKNRKKLALQFLYGLNYLHKKGFLHRDISFRNILLKKYDFSSCVIKLSDFGLIKDLDSKFTKTDTEIKGTIIDPSLDSFKNYTLKHEFYAVAFILNYIFTGKKSLQHQNKEFSKILIKCNDSNFNNRYEDMNLLIQDVENLTW